MCARLLSCPLCSQPGFVTLDALRAGLVSVATRPLACPVCNETLLGIDKLTIHLFGHTINTNNNRTDTHKITDVNCNNNVHGVAHSGSMILPQNWNAFGRQTVVSDCSQVGEVINVPISNLNSPQSLTRIFINKEPETTATSNSQGCPRNEDITEKRQNQIIFVQNSSQQQQIYSQRLIQENHSNVLNIRNADEYQTSVPLVFRSSEENERIPSENRQEHTVEPSGTNSSAIYQSQTVQETTNENTSSPKQPSVAQFSETWFENLLHANNTKCSEDNSKELATEDKNYSISLDISGVPNLQNEVEKYSNCQAAISNQNISAEGPTAQPKNGTDSIDSTASGGEEIFKQSRETTTNSSDVLPQLKAFWLLAMKEKTERCNICGFHFPDRNILILHKQLVHMIAEKDLNAKPEELLKNYPCHLCSKVFKMRGSLMVHMRVAHIGSNLGVDAGSASKDKESELISCDNGFNCPTCGKNFKKEQHVTQHLKTHEGKQWECDVCSKMFTTKYFLKKHKRLHSGEMPYKCTICDKTFTFQQSYHKHRLYHKDDKPHTCSTCGRSFKELSTLHNHERIHTGEKPFVCETCGKCFRQRVSYLVHRRIHTGVMPYKCTACDKSFRYKVSQRTHKCPAQPEDSVTPAIENPTGNTVLQSRSCSDSLITTKTGILLQNQSVSEVASIENNKFILIVNTQGQPILTRESEVDTSNFLNDKQSTEAIDSRKVNQDNGNDVWNRCLSGESISRDSAASAKRECPTNEKIGNSDTNDFFSLVMSPLENDLSSPSSEMEHLRLSSPGNDETRKNESRDNSEIHQSTNSLQSDLNNAIDGIFNDNCTDNESLQTINEESLKQLLYGIDRKV